MKLIKECKENPKLADFWQAFLNIMEGIALILLCAVTTILLMVISMGVVVLGSAYIVQGIRFFLE